MKKIIATFITSAIAVSSFGAWRLIDDFQAYAHGDIFTDAAEIGWNAAAPEGTDEYWMLADPFDATNICMFVESGNYGVGYGNTWVMNGLPDGGIEPGEVGTLYFKCLWSGIDNNWHFGTADKPLAFDDITGIQTTPGAWGDYNALIRLGEAQNLEHRDGGGYVSTNPPQVVVVNNWYHFLLVVDNSWDNSTTPPTSTGTHKLYVQGPNFGDGVSPTLVPVGTDPAKDAAFIRRAPTDDDGNPQPIIWVMFATNSGAPGSPNAGDPFLLDDFAFYKGAERLYIPDAGDLYHGPGPGPLWAGYSIVNIAGDVDTGNFMRWINISAAPFILCYDIGWIYMDEASVTNAGAWGYIYK